MKTCNRGVALGRRQFLTGGATAAAATAAAGMVPRGADATPALARIAYPSSKLANVKDLKVDNPVAIQYPDKDSPGVIIKLGRKVEGGVGPIADLQRGRGIRFAGEQTFQCPLSPSATENHADPQNGLDTRATSRLSLREKA